MLSRRAFLQLASASAAAVAFDPERLLWVPGAKTIFLPPEKTIVIAQEIPVAYHWFTAENMRLMSKELGFTVPPPDWRRFDERHLA